MLKSSIIIGLVTVLAYIPLTASAAPYCGERICHSYDSTGACNNYTCFGSGYRYDRGYYYGSAYRAPYGSYYNTGNRYYDYGDCYGRGGSYYDSNCRYTYSRPSRSSYYRDDWYYPGNDDRIYVPKAGYYYRY